jgi:MFS superfamily sulfate permease-like transporter
MPHPALGAIVIAAMLHLSKPAYLRELFARNRWEFLLAAVVIAGELTLGVLQGIALGVVLALLLLIYRTSHPQGAELGQLPGTEAYNDVRRHPDAMTFPGLLIWRVGGDMFFAAIDHIVAQFRDARGRSGSPVTHVLLDLSSVNLLDTTACDELLRGIKELRAQGITISFARASDNVRRLMRLGKVEAAVGATNFHERLTDGVRAWQTAAARPARAPFGEMEVIP